MSAAEQLNSMIERIGDARLPTEHGEFRIVAFRAADGHEHVALVAGDVDAAVPLVRVHSECLTGDILGSLKCDCGPQLAAAQEAIATEAAIGGAGIVVYLRGHEGRGIGLANKIRAYELQDQGLDTVDANVRQGLPIDAREYDVAAAILADLGVVSVRLMTNNPRKVDGLARHGIEVVDVVALVAAPTTESAGYLRTKRVRLGHLLPE
ncbi:MAG: GTP cyclohydrolase II [Ilumatobacteraceae bacterium]|nr:GTP cyclohydrolase II [Ilumatobacteraceae bacterium]